MSAILHALSAIKPTSFQPQPNIPFRMEEEQALPMTSYISGKFQRAARRVPYQCRRLCLKNMNIQSREKGRYNQLKTTIQDHHSFEELHQIDCQYFWKRSEASTCVYHYSLIRNVTTGMRKMNNTKINSLNTMYLHMPLYKLPCLLSRRA